MTDSENVSVYVMLATFVGEDCAEVKLETVGTVTSVTLAPIVRADEVRPLRLIVYVKESRPVLVPAVGVYVKAPVADVIATVPFVPCVPRAKVTLPVGS